MVFLWGCGCIIVTMKLYLIGLNCAALGVISFSSKLNITAHEHFSTERKVIKQKERPSKCLDSETDCFQTTRIHYMPCNEDILITVKAAPLSSCFY